MTRLRTSDSNTTSSVLEGQCYELSRRSPGASCPLDLAWIRWVEPSTRSKRQDCRHWSLELRPFSVGDRREPARGARVLFLGARLYDGVVDQGPGGTRRESRSGAAELPAPEAGGIPTNVLRTQSGRRLQRWGEQSLSHASGAAGIGHRLTARLLLLCGFAFVVVAASTAPGLAETLSGALTRAYVGNPQLNAQRAQVRAVDEAVPQALSGYRPRAQLQADAGVLFQQERVREEREVTISGADGEAQDITVQTQRTRRQTTLPRGAEFSLEQNLFDGGRTRNSVRQAESQVLAARETLRNSEQNVLLDAAMAYMDVLRDQALLDLQRANAKLLEETLFQARERYATGQITRTDVAQAEARLASARAQVNLAGANLNASRGRYRQVIGTEPRALAQGMPVPDKLLPRDVAAGTRIALTEHPAIAAALHGVDAAELEVKVVKSELYPSVGLAAGLSRRYDSEARGDRLSAGSATLQVNVPIYEGGEVYARTRQAKESTRQRRAEAESARDEVRAALATAWGVLEAANAQIAASQAQIRASEIALNGVRGEAREGQRTTLDVLNAQQELLNARVNLTTAQRDQVVASYALLLATGRLSARTLGLRVQSYDPKRHFDQVKDLRGGMRTPDGR